MNEPIRYKVMPAIFLIESYNNNKEEIRIKYRGLYDGLYKTNKDKYSLSENSLKLMFSIDAMRIALKVFKLDDKIEVIASEGFKLILDTKLHG